MRLIGFLAYAAIIVGIVLLGMQRTDSVSEMDQPPPDLPETLVDEVLRVTSASRFVVVMSDGACGTPFRTALNYLHHLDDIDFAVVTGTQEYDAFRMLEARRGVQVVASDDLLARVLPFGNVILIERGATRPGGFSTTPGPLVYQFQSATTAVLVQAFDDIFGVGEAPARRPDAIQQNLQPVSASNRAARLQRKASRAYF